MRKIKLKDKKAEEGGPHWHIIGWIMLIVGFVILLAVIFRLKFGATTDWEICHNSVILKSKGKGLIGDLDCKINYLCISGGGRCNDFSPKETIIVDANNKNEIMKAIGNELVSCWGMYGEGKENYLGIGEKSILKKTTCATCSIIKFDDTILGKKYKITYSEFYNYLNTLQKDDENTYFSYLYNSNNIEFPTQVFHTSIDYGEEAQANAAETLRTIGAETVGMVMNDDINKPETLMETKTLTIEKPLGWIISSWTTTADSIYPLKCSSLSTGSPIVNCICICPSTKRANFFGGEYLPASDCDLPEAICAKSNFKVNTGNIILYGLIKGNAVIINPVVLTIKEENKNIIGEFPPGTTDVRTPGVELSNYVLEGTDNTYAIMTGFQTGALWGIGGSDKVIQPYYGNINQVSSQLQCKDFIGEA